MTNEPQPAPTPAPRDTQRLVTDDGQTVPLFQPTFTYHQQLELIAAGVVMNKVPMQLTAHGE